MRKKDINGIINDLMELISWRNPVHDNMAFSFIGNKLTLNLLTGKIEYPEEDSLTKLYREKRDWFVKRVHNLGGKLSDFEEATIIVFGAKEKVKIRYKGEVFEKSHMSDFKKSGEY